MRRRILLALAVVFSACGESPEKSSQPNLILSFKQAPQVPYFSKIFLRVSYPEGRPYQEERIGRFLPGDVVAFELNIPEGKERTIEVFLYDPQGKAIYYRSVYLPDLGKKDSIRIELLPSEGKVELFELRSDGRLKKDGSFELFSEDLYSYNGKFEGYVNGKFLGYREGSRAYMVYVEDGSKNVEVEYEKEIKVSVKTPIPLFITGSVEGFVENSEEFFIGSKSVSMDGTALICGISENNVFYTITDKLESMSPVPACPSSCTSYQINPHPSLIPSEPLLIYNQIACLGGFLSASQVAFPKEGKHYMGFDFESKTPCHSVVRLYAEPENNTFRPQPNNYTFILPSPSEFRIYSEDGLYSARVSCRVPQVVAVNLPQLKEKKLWLERRLEGYTYARAYEGSKIEWKKEEHIIKSFEIKREGDHIFVKYEKEGAFKSCELELKNSKLTLYIKGIPPYRSHLKISENNLTKELFQEEPRARLRCHFEGGWVEYTQTQGVKNPTVASPVSF